MSKHLGEQKKIKNGSFYTPKFLVNRLFMLIKEEKTLKNPMFIDTSCGYGSFLVKNKSIGFDIDEVAIKVARTKGFIAFNVNSLSNMGIKSINEKINEFTSNSHLIPIIIGNPPYNNYSSFYRKKQKGDFIGSTKYKSRDLGISFLKSFVDIKVDYVCVLHPLSFLIKKTNFNSLKEFKNNFKLINSYVFPSTIFPELKKKTPFPIIIGLYKRIKEGIDYEYITNYEFNILDKFKFRYGSLETIDNIVDKYKRKTIKKNYKHFQTLRDINALSRNTTWLKKETYSSIRVTKDKEFVYKSLENLKHEYKDNMNKFFFIGNCSPIFSHDFFLRKKIMTRTIYNQYIHERMIKWKTKK